MPETQQTRSRRFRDVLGHVPTGVTLVTGRTETGEPLGMVVGSFTSVSLEPPLVAYFPMKSSTTFARLRETDRFAVNVLAADHQDLCRAFTSRRADRWDGVSWQLSPGGCPLLEDAIAWVDCRVVTIQEAGDHYMVLGEVTDLSDQRPAPPLLFFQGDYATLGSGGRLTEIQDVARAWTTLARLQPALETFLAETGLRCEVWARSGDDLVVISTHGDGVGRPAGTRIPLVAPLADAWIAFAPEHDGDRWLSAARIEDPEALAAVAERLRRTRAQGWSGPVIPEADAGFLGETQLRHSRGELTPALRRRLHERCRRWARTANELSRPSPDGHYDLPGISVPVLGENGFAVLMLLVTGLPRRMPAAEFESTVARIRQVARSVAGASPAEPN